MRLEVVKSKEDDYKIYDILLAITNAKGTNSKTQILEDNKDNEGLKKVLNFVFNPFIVSGISDKKINKHIESPSPMGNDDLFNTIDYIKKNNTGKDIDIEHVQNVLLNSSQKYWDIIRKIFCRNFHDLGVSTVTINKVWKGFIPSFSVQLADRYYDCPHAVDGHEFTITEKVDGERTVLIKDNGNISIFARSGKRMIGLVDIENAAMNMQKDNFVLDCECTITDRNSHPSKMQYKLTTKILMTDDTEKHGVCLNAFDYLTLDEWKNQKCVTPYSERRKPLNNFKGLSEYINVLPEIYVGSDVDMITKYHDDAKAKNQEGVMVNLNDAYYEFKRTKKLLKCKTFLDCDAYVDGMDAGNGKNSDRLGALHCHFVDKDNDTIQFDCGGGFSDSDRINIWNNKNEYIGRVGEFTYFEVTKDKSGKKSIRFPVFKCFKDKGTVPNN